MAAMPGYDCPVEMTSQFRLYDHERDQQLAEQQHNKQLEIEEQTQQLQQQEKAMMMIQDELTADQMELSVPGNGELTASEWQLGCGDHGGGLLDLPSATAADHHEYWSQSQWIHHHDDHHLFLPP
ncbi:hypothetical protein Sjap_015383 [Stephania japonica]|uniref:Uncharacterized protein n=1 Tax=Stephania japonica TaxID=461633 RepID=A0AAP0IJ09_9MAGN